MISLLLLFLLPFVKSQDYCNLLEEECWRQCGSPLIFPFRESCLTSFSDFKVSSCYTSQNCICNIPESLRTIGGPLQCQQKACSSWGTISVTSNFWLKNCGNNCSGYQSDCIRNNNFCVTNAVGGGLQMCKRWRQEMCRIGNYNGLTCDGTTTTYSPIMFTPAPTPKPTSFPTLFPTSITFTQKPTTSFPTTFPTPFLTTQKTTTPISSTTNYTQTPTPTPFVNYTNSGPTPLESAGIFAIVMLTIVTMLVMIWCTLLKQKLVMSQIHGNGSEAIELGKINESETNNIVNVTANTISSVPINSKELQPKTNEEDSERDSEREFLNIVKQIAPETTSYRKLRRELHKQKRIDRIARKEAWETES